MKTKYYNFWAAKAHYEKCDPTRPHECCGTCIQLIELLYRSKTSLKCNKLKLTNNSSTDIEADHICDFFRLDEKKVKGYRND